MSEEKKIANLRARLEYLKRELDQRHPEKLKFNLRIVLRDLENQLRWATESKQPIFVNVRTHYRDNQYAAAGELK